MATSYTSKAQNKAQKKAPLQVYMYVLSTASYHSQLADVRIHKLQSEMDGLLAFHVERSVSKKTYVTRGTKGKATEQVQKQLVKAKMGRTSVCR